MSEHGEGHVSGRQKLEQAKTLEDILETAMGFEKTAQAFYAGLVDRVRKPIRQLVAELAEEEAGHYALFKGVRDHADTMAQLKEMIATPVNDHKFSDYVQMPDLGENPDDQAVLQYALGREDAAYQQYSELAGSTPEGPLRDLFQYLADEELRHKGELEKRYYELVHSGGV